LERALDHGARLVEGVTVTDLTQDDDGVRLSGVDQDGGTTVTEAAYVVGTDGHRSLSGGLIHAALRRDPVTRAMRDVAIRTATSLPRVRAALVGRVSGVGLRYPAPAGSH